MSIKKENSDKKKVLIKPQIPAVNVTPDLKTPEQIAQLRHRPLNRIEPVQGKAEASTTVGPKMTRRNDSIIRIEPVRGKATTINREQVVAPANPATKISSLDMFTEQENNITKNKKEDVKTNKNTSKTRKEKVEESNAKRLKPLEKIEAYIPGKTDALKGVYGTESVNPTPVVGKAEIQNPTSIVNPAIEASRPLTLSDMLAEQRQNAIKDKTDAVKMQKYYALTDALGALGKMGGAAVGGAIKGNMLDSAPAVGEYQPSRGYVDAFERAQKANDRLRALDDKQFQLAYSKQQRDDERAYTEKKTIEDRSYQAQQNRLNREYQAEQARLTREWNKAVADGNREEQARIERDLIVLKHQNDMALQNLRNQGALDEKKAGQTYSKWQADMYNTTPIRFSDGTTIKIPDNYYEAIKRSLVNTKVNDKTITKDNVDSFIVNNPALINQYLADWGFVPNKQEEQAPATTTPPVKKTPDSGPSSRIDYATKHGPSSHNEIKEGSDEASMEEKKNKWRNRNSN